MNALCMPLLNASIGIYGTYSNNINFETYVDWGTGGIAFDLEYGFFSICSVINWQTTNLINSSNNSIVSSLYSQGENISFTKLSESSFEELTLLKYGSAFPIKTNTILKALSTPGISNNGIHISSLDLFKLTTILVSIKNNTYMPYMPSNGLCFILDNLIFGTNKNPLLTPIVVWNPGAPGSGLDYTRATYTISIGQDSKIALGYTANTTIGFVLLSNYYGNNYFYTRGGFLSAKRILEERVSLGLYLNS